MTSISSFLYRLPRFDIHFPVEFVTPAGTTAGRCLNLSDTGLLACFLLPLGGGEQGMLRLSPAGRVFDLAASVMHSDGQKSGLRFHFATDQQQQIIRALVNAANFGATHR